MTGPMLKLENVHTHIGAYHILHGVSFEVPKGKLTLLLGRNGAGKTTTLRTIMGLWKASHGRVIFDGKDIASLPTPEIARSHISYVPENMSIFADLTVAENMTLAARSAKRAKIEPSKLLLIDEPSKGLAPAIIQNMVSAFQELKRTDTTILLVEQNFGFAKQLGDTVAVIDDGRIVHAGTMADLAKDEGLQQKLLGLSLSGHQSTATARTGR